MPERGLRSWRWLSRLRPYRSAAGSTGTALEQSPRYRARRGKIMLEESLLMLAGAAGTAIVKSMATETWTAVRSRVVDAFSRTGKKQQQTIEDALDHDADTMNRTSENTRDVVLDELAPVWRGRVVDLLEDRPEHEHASLASDLRALVEMVTRSGSVDGSVTQAVAESYAGRDINQIGSVGGDFTTGSGRG
jgi:hypothetical protein